MSAVVESRSREEVAMQRLVDVLRGNDTAQRWLHDGADKRDLGLTAENIYRHSVAAVTHVALGEALNALNPSRSREGDVLALCQGLRRMQERSV